MKETMSDSATRAATPLRDLPYNDHLGCRQISPPRSDYEDGGEDRVLEIISGATDLSALSDELESLAETWPERYHLSKSRANCLRPFTLTRDMRVLDVGGGCGAIARYLGEACGTVDVLEPTPQRAATARARTRDLGNVEVFIGDVEAIPAEPAYDLITVIGVLEYVGGSEASNESRRSFLETLSRLLRSGGAIVCAIENRIGVKYLAGAPEDHSGRPFDGLEGYWGDSPARTFSRPELERVFGTAGLRTGFFHAFPDYKLARVVFSDSIFESPEGRALAVQVPRFPSPDWTTPREPGADEELLWKTLIEAGLGSQFSNSFIVVASRDDPKVAWRPDLLGAFYTTSRRRKFATETHITKGPRFRRTRMDGSKSDLAEGDLLHRVDDSDYMHGVPMIEAMASADEAALRSLLLEWKQLLERSPAPSLELVPANLIVSPSGEIEAIDQEWSIEGSTTAHVLERGAVWTAHHLARLTNPARWTSVGETVRDVAIHLSSMIDLDPAGGWIEAAITREAELQAVVHDCEREAPGFPAHAQSRREQLSELISARIEDGPLGAQRGIASRLAVAEALVIEQEGHIGRLREMASEKDRHIQNLQAMAEEKDGHIAHLQATAEEKDAALAQSHKELERVREFSLARLTDAAARLRKKSSNK